MKMLNANWMSAIAQPCALFIGCTNSVQLYWRLAIIIMQTTPKMSCAQRLTGVAALCGGGILPPSRFAAATTRGRRRQSAVAEVGSWCHSRPDGARVGLLPGDGG